jgi:hypothetical protein
MFSRGSLTAVEGGCAHLPGAWRLHLLPPSQPQWTATPLGLSGAPTRMAAARSSSSQGWPPHQ